MHHITYVDDEYAVLSVRQYGCVDDEYAVLSVRQYGCVDDEYAVLSVGQYGCGVNRMCLSNQPMCYFNTLRAGDADLRF